MNISRRRFLHLAGGAAVLSVASPMAWAGNYPARPVRWVVPQAAGGASDVSARLMGQWLSERLGQPFVIENRPGAGGTLGTEAVVTAPGDGYTLLLVGSFNAIGATLYDKLNYNFIRDIAPVAGIMRNPLLMVVNPTFAAKTVAEFITYAKANPGKLTMASAGNGTPQHLAGELFKMMAGVNLVHVPYRGSAALLTDMLRGEAHVTFDPMLSSIEHVRAGRLRALAVTTATRSETLPDIPTVGESVPGYEYTGWVGIGVPRGTPVEIIEKLNLEVTAGLASSTIKARLADLGGAPLVSSPADFGKLIAEQTDRWAKVIRAANIKPD
jgi:tripartite-type tricarboxylate transporter receptor subunit TctC